MPSRGAAKTQPLRSAVNHILPSWETISSTGITQSCAGARNSKVYQRDISARRWLTPDSCLMFFYQGGAARNGVNSLIIHDRERGPAGNTMVREVHTFL